MSVSTPAKRAVKTAVPRSGGDDGTCPLGMWQGAKMFRHLVLKSAVVKQPAQRAADGGGFVVENVAGDAFEISATRNGRNHGRCLSKEQGLPALFAAEEMAAPEAVG